ncbi:MAG TPA: right-handed parallel beta-helix repeat-containing protein, partial [Pilimelia sp.]|nr:right-handed parallel beta-helix repeat-containing protein [Pilimelia sp.]
PDAPPAAAAVPRAVACPAATVRVATAARLTRALAAARPGSSIRLADGFYRGRFVLRAGGRPGAPVHLCGGPRAVLDAGSADRGQAVHVAGASHLRLIGFTVRRGERGVLVERARDVVMHGLRVESSGAEGIRLRRFATDNVVQDSTVHGTGRRRPARGYGVQIGTAKAQWCLVSACRPDSSDRNVVRYNHIAGTTAESVDVREGTSGGAVVGNTFDGARLAAAYADSWVDVGGNAWLVRGNRGRRSVGDGFQTHQAAAGWGRGNVFAGNSARVDGPGWGFHMAPVLDNLVVCDNDSRGARKGLANITCTPG